MRMLVLFLFVGLTLAAPQGYNYQLNVIPYGNGTLTYPQQLQKFANQQEQSVAQQQFVSLASAEVPALTQHIAPSGGNGGSQFSSHLIQHVSYGQPQQQPLPQSLPHPQPQPPPQSQQQPLPQVQPLSQLQHQLQQQQLLPKQQSLPQLQQQHQPLPQPDTQPQFIPQQQTSAQQQPQPQIQQSLPQIIPQPEVQQSRPSLQYSSAAAPARAPETAYYNKEFYYLAAPQENYELPADFDDQLRKMKKNLRIVFIKAPEHTGLEKAALQLVKDAQQPKTAIYVLTKQHSAAELAKKLQQQPGAAHQKPEVIFIKYRTRQDAEQAQRTIQSQYEALNGPNHFNFESVAKTENFVSQHAVVEPRASSVLESVAPQPAATRSPLDYLPPAHGK